MTLRPCKIVALGKNGGLALVPPVPASQPLATNLALGDTSYCGSNVGGVEKPNSTKSYKLNHAPAPPSCLIAACSPSGAFLDEPTF